MVKRSPEEGDVVICGVGSNPMGDANFNLNLDIMKTEKKVTSELTKGDVVSFYGALFLVTASAEASPNFPDADIPVYIAPCERIDDPHEPYDLDDILNKYKKFQGNDRATWEVVK